MPAVLRIGPYRFFFYSADGKEPAHIHVERDENVAKLWLEPVRLASSGGYRSAELRSIEKLAVEHQPEQLEAWNELFGA